MFKKKYKIAGRKIIILPFKAKEGLEILIELAKLIDPFIPILTALHDKSNVVRIAALTKFVSGSPDLYKFIFNLVSKSTGIPVEVLEEDATLSEVLELSYVIMKKNNWDDFWKAANALNLVEKDQFISWNFFRKYKE